MKKLKPIEKDLKPFKGLFEIFFELECHLSDEKDKMLFFLVMIEAF